MMREGLKMSRMNIKYLSDDALSYFKANPEFMSKKLSENPTSSEWLKESFNGLLYVQKNYEIERPCLVVPADNTDRETDYKNSVEIFKCFKDLPRYVLSDVRFWLWVNFDLAYEVALANIPISEGSSVFKNAWLFNEGVRRGQFFGPISRCFYRVFLTYQADLEDPFEYSKFVIKEPLRFREYSWRKYSSNPKILSGALSASKKVLSEFGDSVEKPSKYYKELAMEVSRAGSLRIIDVMDDTEIQEIVYDKYLELLEEDI